MTSRDAIYRAFVQSYNATTGIVSCTIPKLYGAAIFTAKPAISSTAEIPNIAPPRVGSQIFVFFDGGVDNAPFWMPRVMDGAFDDAYVNVTGDTMTGELFGTDVTLSGDLTAVNGVLSGNAAVTGGATITGDVAVNGGNMTSSATTFNLLATPTTVNVAQAATAISIGATTGLTTIRNRVLANGTGVNEQVTLQVTGTPTGGSFILMVAGVPVTLTYNSTTLATTNAFNAQLGAGAVTVTGGTFPGAAQVVTFTADYAGSDVQLPALVVNQLTGGTSPSVTITLTTPGAGAVTASTVAAGVVSGPRALFASGQFGTLVTASLGTNITTRTADVGSSAIIIPATVHQTSERAGITIGDWIIGQDVAGNGTKDFFLWNGATRLSIAPTGEVAVGVFTASSINSITVRAQDGTNEGGEIALAGAGVHSAYHIDQFQNTLRFLKDGFIRASISSTGTVGANQFAVVSGGNYYIDGDGNFQRYTHTGDFADAAPYWAEGPLLVGNTGWAFYHGLAGSPRMGFRGNAANTVRYLWCADGTLLGQGPNDSAINAIVNVWGRGGSTNSAIWFQDMPGNPSGSTVVNAFGNLYQFTSRGALKENIVDVDGATALARVMAARPREFTFKPDKIGNGNEFTSFDVKRGFIAEEIAEVDHTYAVWGWVTEDDRVQTDVSDVQLEEAVPTSWDSTAVVADLVAAVQHLTRRVTALEG